MTTHFFNGSENLERASSNRANPPEAGEIETMLGDILSANEIAKNRIQKQMELRTILACSASENAHNQDPESLAMQKEIGSMGDDENQFVN